MGVIVGSARIDENGNISGGQAGDQTGSEVMEQDFYVHSLGWYILRPKSDAVASGIARAMKQACENNNIGYDQDQRYGILTYGTASRVPTECDCTSLVRECIKEASGTDVGDFYTGNMAACLENSGLFNGRISYTSGTVLYTGDVLVTKSKGHTVAVTSGTKRGGDEVGDYSFQLKDIVGGSNGKHVKFFQRLAKAKGFFNDKIDGDCGKITTQAIYAVQKAYGLKQDGCCGINTWCALTGLGHVGYLFTIKKVFKCCPNSDSTEVVQYLLKLEKYKGSDGRELTTDGDCGANTEYAIKQYQAKNGLTVDGQAAEKTLSKLIAV